MFDPLREQSRAIVANVGERDAAANIVAGTPGNDFIHVLGDSHVAPASYTDIASATNGNDLIDPGSGEDFVYAGDGNDRIDLGGNLTAQDVVDGEGGNDTVVLAGTYDITFNATTLVSVESVLLDAGFNYRIVIADETLAAGESLTVDGSALPAADRLVFDARNDTDGGFLRVIGGAGSDTLISGASAVSKLEGGAGDDTLWMGASDRNGHYDLSGGAGADRLIGGDGITVLLGGGGADWIEAGFAGAGPSFVHGGGGDDYLDLQGVVKQVSGGDGIDTVSLGNATLAMQIFSAASTGIERFDRYGSDSFGDDHRNVIDLSGFVMLSDGAIDGRGGDDTLIGNDATGDGLRGGKGDDILQGRGGDDFLSGGAGHNQIVGGSGNDLIFVEQPIPGHSFPKEFDTMNGGAGDDTIILRGPGDFVVRGGSGSDLIQVEGATLRPGSIDGGGGMDTIDLQSAILDFAHFDADSFVGVELIGPFPSVLGSSSDNELDFSGFGISGTEGISADGRGGNDVITGTKLHDELNGSAGNDTLNGGSGADALYGGTGSDTISGGAGDDTVDGGAGKDLIYPGAGHDLVRFDQASESTGARFDTIVGFDGQKDLFYLTANVSAVDPVVAQGTLSLATFDSDLAAAIGEPQLGNYHAVLFTPESGSLATSTFLIVDMNGVAGYQAGQDLVVNLAGLTNANHITTETFIF